MERNWISDISEPSSVAESFRIAPDAEFYLAQIHLQFNGRKARDILGL
jgi:hypothetical protein